VDGRFRNQDGSPGFHAEFYGDSIRIPSGAMVAAITRPLYELDFPGPLPARGTAFTAQLTRRTATDSATDQVTVVQISGP
jgi:hypothetical protein